MDGRLRLFLICLSFTANGCVTAPPVELDSGAEKVKVGKSDPVESAEMLGAISVVDGYDCGAFGYRGSYGRSVVLLQNEAHKRGANFAQIMAITEPHLRGDCFDNQYVISATLFKIKGNDSVTNSKPATSNSNASKLRELKMLFDDKIITDQEFKEQRKKILDSGI